jgi:mRNA interferase MazF
MKRGEIYLVDLDPSRGSEANKSRPAIVVSNDGANATAAHLGRGVVTVVPLTGNTGRVYPFQVLLPRAATGLSKDSKAQAEQVRRVAVERLLHRVGVVPSSLLSDIDSALRLHLALD